MAGKVTLVILLTFTLLLTSCYPQLSVQQYDKLRQDITSLDTERQQLSAELDALKAKNAETLGYVTFLEKLESTQSSDKILSGKFDVESLLTAKPELTTMAEGLGDSSIVSFLEPMKPNSDNNTVASYNKITQICLNKIKANLK